MTFKEELNLKASDIEKYLDGYMPLFKGNQEVLSEAMRYSLLCGGKRIRPVMMLSITKALGIDEKRVIPFACAIEMLHTASLIVDDLPALDNDDYRRGRLSCHAKYGESTAIMAACSMIIKALEITAATGEYKASEYLAASSGIDGVYGGEYIDVVSEGKSLPYDELLYMYSKKTGALLKATACVPCIIAGKLESKEADMLIKYSDIIGLAFQIKDDILDIEGDAKKLGKATGMDVNKTTYVSYNGLEKSKQTLKSMTNEALDICNYLSESGLCDREACGFLSNMAMFLLDREY